MDLGRIPLLNHTQKVKPKAFITIIITEEDKVSLSMSSKNPITNLGLLNVAIKMISLDAPVSKGENGNP